MTDPFAEINTYLDTEGRLTQWPSKRSLQLIALDYLAGKLESRKSYSEDDINALLRQGHTFGDWALLRRELYERGLLNRKQDGTQYWYTPKTKFL
jgi:hypothetical protein